MPGEMNFPASPKRARLPKVAVNPPASVVKSVEPGEGLSSPEASGERFLPGMRGSIETEHLHRYHFAVAAVRGKRVLDIACGDGYGSALLAAEAEHVIGVDIDAGAIERAVALYPRPNLRFAVGTCASIPLDDQSMDVVVSFETLEHHDRHEAMLLEIKRVLKPDGCVVISTPDKLEYSVIPNYFNPYHVLELAREEFVTLVTRHFRETALFGQRVMTGSLIAPLAKGILGETEPLVDASETSEAVSVRRPLYLIAVASDHSLPRMESGYLEHGDEASYASGPDPMRFGLARIYWAGEDGLFSEERSLASQIMLDSTWQQVAFDIPASVDASYIRFDPLEHRGPFAVTDLLWSTNGGSSIARIVSPSSLPGHSNHIEWQRSDWSDGIIRGSSTGDDPFFVVALPVIDGPRAATSRFAATVSYPARLQDVPPFIKR